MAAQELTAEQADVVAFNDGALLVLAGPGSGKTRVLTQRIVRLLRESPGETFRILALTFTNRAADHMRQRVREEVGDAWRRTQITTFHAFALDTLQRHGGHIGLPPNLTIYDTLADRVAVLIQGLRDDGFHQSVARGVLERALLRISRYKHDLVGPTAVVGTLMEGITLGAAFAAYDATLRRSGAVDLDDLLVLCHRLFSEAPRVSDLYRRLCRYILIDEAQDTNRAQYQLLRALCGEEHRNVMLVADGDQHIYRFAGADHRYLKLFLRDFGAQQRTLAINFRCDPEIVAVANGLITHNADRLPRPAAVAYRGAAGGAVAVHELEDEAAEARMAGDAVQQVLTSTDSPNPERLAVLGRNRYVLDASRRELERRGIAILFRTTEAEILASRQGRVLHLALHILHNASDVVRLETLAAALRLNGSAFLGKAEGQGILGDARAVLTEFVQQAPRSWERLFGPLAARAAQGTHADIAGYLPALLSMLENDVRPEDRELATRDAAFLRSRFAAYREALADAEPDLCGFLGHLALATEAEGDGVRVLTVHAAKGLEFHAVWVLGMNQGTFPDYRSLQEGAEAVEEERRAAYVAVTRAQQRLTLTRPRRRRMPWGETQTQQPSQFLAEMGLSATGRPSGAAEEGAEWSPP